MHYFQPYLNTILLTLKATSLLGFLFFSQLGYAQQWYHVELIVFEQLNSVSDEQAPIATVPDSPFSPSTANTLIQPSENSTLLESANKLRRSPFYQVHYHQSWRQPIQTKSQAKSLQIISADDMIHGQIRLHKGTYLFATLDLQLNRVSRQNNSWSDASEIRKPYLQDSRRVRSKKLHFFDHPKLGALLKLTPIASPEIDSSSSTPTQGSQ